VTPLDAAFLAAEAEGAPESARARFYALLVETTLCAPVDAAPEDAPLRPLVFDLSAGRVGLAFDDDARMAAFFGEPVEYVAMPGRALVAALAGAGLGLGLNLGDAPSATLLDADAVAWIAREMGGGVEADAVAGPVAVLPPAGASAALLETLAGRVAALAGLVAEAWLVRLSTGGAPAALTLAILPAPAAARGAEGLAAELGRLAQPFAPEGEAVATAALREDHPLLAACRAQGVGLHPGPRPEADTPRPTAAPPRLR
jgi:hypothetical protein